MGQIKKGIFYFLSNSFKTGKNKAQAGGDIMQITISYNKGKYDNFKTTALEKDFRHARELSDMLWFDESFRIYEELAQKNYMPAVYEAGLAYFYGEGVECDDESALRLFEKGAASGHLPSAKMAGDCYLRGYGTKVD